MARLWNCPYCKKKHDEAVKKCPYEAQYKRTLRTEYQREGDKFLSSTQWKRKRAFILQQDNKLCQRCLIKYKIINAKDLTVHHIKSRYHYPELRLDDANLITVCRSCNSQLGTRDVLDFEWERNQSIEWC